MTTHHVASGLSHSASEQQSRHGEQHLTIARQSQRPVGELLHQWRERRRLSQMELALDAEISTRHLSFVETGRSTPSREMVLHLTEQLDLPLRERNHLPRLRGGRRRLVLADSVASCRRRDPRCGETFETSNDIAALTQVEQQSRRRAEKRAVRRGRA